MCRPVSRTAHAGNKTHDYNYYCLDLTFRAGESGPVEKYFFVLIFKSFSILTFCAACTLSVMYNNYIFHANSENMPK